MANPPQTPDAPDAPDTGAEAPRPRRRWLRRVLWSLLALLLLVLAAVPTALLVLQTEWGKARALEFALSAVNAGIRGEIRVERIEGPVVRRVSLVGVTISDPEGAPALSLARLDLEYRLWPLLGKRVEIHSLNLDTPEAEILDAQGRVRLARAFAAQDVDPNPTPSTGLDWTIVLDQIAVADARIAQSAAEGAIALTELTLQASIALDGQGLRWDEVRVTGRAEGLPVDRIELVAAGALRGDSLVMDSLEVVAGPHQLDLRGRIDRLDAPILAFEVERAHVELEPLGGLLGRPDLRGTIDGRGSVAGPLDHLAAALDFNSPGGALSIRGSGDVLAANPSWIVAVAARGLRPQSLAPEFEWPLVLSFDLSGRGEGDPTTDGEAHASLRLSELSGIEGVPVPIVVEASAVRGALSVDASAEDERGGRLRLSASAPRLPPTPVALDLELSSIDLGAWTKLFGVAGVSGTVEALRVDATADVAVAAGAPELSRASGALTMEARDLQTPESLGVASSVGTVSVSGDLAWGGQGLPTGQLHARLTDAAALDVSAKAAELSVYTEPADGGLALRGTASTAGLMQGREVGVGRASAEFSARVEDQGNVMGTADVDVEVSSLRVPGVALAVAAADLGLRFDGDQLTARGPVSGRRLALSSGLTLGAFAGTIDATVPVAHPDRARASVDMSLSALRVDDETGVDQATVRGSVALGAGLPTLDATIGAQGIRLAAVPLDKATLHASFSPQQGGVLDLRADGEDARVLLGVSVDRVESGKPWVATVRELELRRDDHGFAATPGAKLRYLPKTGGVSVTGLQLRDLSQPEGVLFVGGLVELERQSVNASLSAEKVPIGAWLSSLRGLGLLADGELDLSGVLDLRATVEGTLERPQIAASGGLQGGAIGPIRDLGLAFDATIGDGGTRGTLEARYNGDRSITGSLESDARVSFTAAPAVDRRTSVEAELRISHVVLEDFETWLDFGDEDPPTGRLDGSIVVGGTLGTMVAAVDLDLSAFSYGPMEDASAHLGVTVGHLGSQVEVRLVDDSVERLRLSASVPSNIAEIVAAPAPFAELAERLRREPLALELRIAKTRLGDLPFTSGLGDLRSATAVAAVDAWGTLGDPWIGGQLRVDDLRVRGGSASIGLDVVTRDSNLELAAAISGGGREALRVEGVLPQFGKRIVSARPIQAFVDDPLTRLDFTSSATANTITDIAPGFGRFLDGAVPDTQLALTLTAAGGPDAEIRVILDAEAAAAREAAASPAEPDEPPSDAARALANALASAVRADVRVRRKSTLATVSLEQAGGGRLFVEASAPIGIAGLLGGADLASIDLGGSVGSDSFALTGLRDALPSVFGPTTGTLDADVVIAGTIGAPQLDGRIVARFAHVTIAPLGLALDDTDIALRLAPDRLVIEPIRIERDGGTLDLRLAAETPNLAVEAWPIDGAVSLHRFRAVSRRDAKVTASGDVLISGTIGGPTITGELTVTDGTLDPKLGGRVVHSTEMPLDVVFVASDDLGLSEEALAAEDALPDPRLGALRIDATVIVPKRTFFVKNDMFDIELSGRIHALVRGEEIALDGIITVERGTVKVLGREFVLAEDSRVVFDGSPTLDPILDVTATYDMSDVDLSPLGLTATDDSKIFVRVTGPATEPTLKLSSNPPMDETNIVSVITVGHPVGGGGDGPGVRGQLLTAVVGLALGPATRFVQDKLPLDVLKLEVGEDAALSDARITAGTRIVRDLYILYDADLGAKENDNVHELRIVYAIKGGFKVETYFGDAGKGGIELLLRRTF
jgi:autotransporter translocation and assembly factor TamB